MKSVVVEFIEIDKLEWASFNPGIRTEYKNLRDLMNNMEEYGFLVSQPVTIMENNKVVDGHRRIACAKALGIKEVPCIRETVFKTVDEAWGVISTGKRSLGTRDVIEAIHKNMKFFPNNSGGYNAKRLVENYGMAMLDYLSENGYKYNVIAYSEKLSRYISNTDRAYTEKIIKWMNELNQVNVTRIALETGYPPKNFRDKVDNNEPITFK